MRPFDWEEDEGLDKDKADERWYRGPDNAPLLSGQFWALWLNHRAEFRALRSKVEEIEERMLDTRARHVAGSVFSTLWGRFIVLVLAVLTAFLLTSIGKPGWLP